MRVGGQLGNNVGLIKMFFKIVRSEVHLTDQDSY